MAAPQNIAQLQRQYAQLAQVPADIRGLIAKDAIDSQKSVLAFPYYSAVRVSATRSGAGPYSYDYAGGTTKCFNYGIGGVMDMAGFTPGTIATASETNVLAASQTRDNSDVLIWGLAAYLAPNSDRLVAEKVWRNSSVFLSLSGTDTFQVGRLEMLPSAGGFYGSASSALVTPPLNASSDTEKGYINNGNPIASNFLRFPNAIRWNANGSGKKDTSLIISLQTNAFNAASGVADRVSASGVAPYSAPATAFADIVFRLVSVSISERSVNT